MKKTIKIHASDNVAVALVHLDKNDYVEGVVLKEAISQGHKFSLTEIQKGQQIIKYGYPIGHASQMIEVGCHVHVHNVETNLKDVIEYQYEPVKIEHRKTESGTFLGYMRKNGEAGIRNELWIIPTVGCVNGIVKRLEIQSQKYIQDSVEAIVGFTHPYGCSQMGTDQENTRRILADLMVHPNAGGVLVVGLGCENSSIEEIKKYLPQYDEQRIRFVQTQDDEDEMEVCMKQIEELVEYMKEDKKEQISLSKLKIGLKCGGSDGLSGITANPVVGAFSDLLIEQGGTTVLTEVPEMFGAETILMNRCESRELFDKTVKMINDFKQYFLSHHQTIYENPSPGNKEGGISTLEDKSLGCTQKSGNSSVVGVLNYGERIEKAGLNLLSAPGNDLIAATALAASGCQMVLFTTGRGTPFATAVPTVKISTNTALYNKKKRWIDFNAGTAVEHQSIQECAQDLFHMVIDIAEGKCVKSEEERMAEISLWKQGVTL